MAYNPIAPTSSRENRKPPTNVPQGGQLVQLEDGRWALDTAAASSDGEMVQLEDGRWAIDDTDPGNAIVVRLGRRFVAFTVS